MGGRGGAGRWGDAGRDRLDGNLDDDTLHGGGGDDLLNGGVGRDTLIGGAGEDVFQFSAEADHDVIRDFSVGVDHVDLIDVFRDAAPIEVTGPGGFSRLIEGATHGGAAYRIANRAAGPEPGGSGLAGTEDSPMLARFVGVAPDAITGSLSSFTLFEDQSPQSGAPAGTDDTALQASALPANLAGGAPAPSPAPAPAAGAKPAATPEYIFETADCASRAAPEPDLFTLKTMPSETGAVLDFFGDGAIEPGAAGSTGPWV